MHYVALVLSIALNATSLILLKKHAMALAAADRDHRTPTLSLRLLDPALLVAVCLYAVAAFSWTVALFGVDLLVAYPTLASTYVIIGLVAPRLFAEELSPNRWIGMVVISAGVVIINL